MAQKTQSKFYQKLGKKLDTAVNKHKDDETDFGRGVDLPGDIPNGVACLSKCYFKEYGKDTKQVTADGKSAAGEWFFYADGVVAEPTVNSKGVAAKGLLTKMTIPVCDCKYMGEMKTQEDMVGIILNELRKLDEGLVKGASGADMEAIAETLATAKPYFRFSSMYPTKEKIDPKTGQPYAPRPFQNWYGSKGLENYVPPDTAGEMTEDRSGDPQEAPEVEEAQEPDETTPDASDDAVDAGEDVSDVEVLVGLAETADLEDESDECEEAQKELKKIAEEAGIAPKKVKGASNWAEVVEMIQEAKAESAPEEDAEEVAEETAEDDKYAVGKTFKYAPIVKTKDKAGKITTVKKKPLDVEIMEVDAEKETCVCKNLVDDKTLYKGVKFADLIED